MYKPWERLTQSRKFWLLVLDSVVTIVLHFGAVIKPEILEHIKFLTLVLQPVFVMVILGITVEDAASNLANKQD